MFHKVGSFLGRKASLASAKGNTETTEDARRTRRVCFQKQSFSEISVSSPSPPCSNKSPYGNHSPPPRLCASAGQRQRGFSLIELVVTIVILAVAVGAIVSVYTFTVARSADPMIRTQLVAVAEAYMDEITSKEIDPETPIPDPRSQRNVIDPYDGESYSPPSDATGEAMPGLDDYSVDISVDDGAFGLGDDSREIEVCAEHTSGERICLTGYRTDY